MKQPTSVSATDFVRHSKTILRRVLVDGEHLLLESNGYPIAVILPVADYARQQTSKSETVGVKQPRRADE